MIKEDMDTQVSVDSLLEQTFKDIGIPARPEIIDRISAEMIKVDPNFRQLAQIISADVGLSASLMKTANSPFFGLNRQSHSPLEALMMLGLDVASQAVAGICLRNAFPPGRQTEIILRRSAKVAALSGWLAKTAGRKKLRTDAAYTYGLFRDCGMPVMLKRFPSYEAVLKRANEDPLLAFTQVEHFGLPDFPIDHALVGFLLAKDWWLPEEIASAIRHHHEFVALEPTASGLPSSSRYLIAIGQTAEHLLEQLTGEPHSNEWAKLGAACLRILDLAEDDLAALYEEAAEILNLVE